MLFVLLCLLQTAVNDSLEADNTFRFPSQGLDALVEKRLESSIPPLASQSYFVCYKLQMKVEVNFLINSTTF